MELTKNAVISMYMAVMKEKGTECTSVVDFAEILKILMGSEEFTDFMVKIKTLSFEPQDIEEHPNTTFLNDNTAFWCFEMSEEQKQEVYKQYKEDVLTIAKARSKYDRSIKMKKESKGKITMAYDDANGLYTLDYYFEPLNFCDTRLFTDGKITDKGIVAGEGMFESAREVKVSDSTFTILVDYKNNIPLAAEVRGFTTTDFDMVFDEAQRLLTSNNMSYKEAIKETPKVYKLRTH